MILKNTLNLKVSNEMWISCTCEQVVDNEEEARQQGKDFNKFFSAYVEGFSEEQTE